MSWDAPGTVYFYSGSRGRHRALSNFSVHDPFGMWLPADLDPTRYLLADEPVPQDVLVQCTNGEVAFHLGKLGGYPDEAGNWAALGRLVNAEGPLQAKRLADRRSGLPLPARWDELGRALWMLEVCRAKFSQLPALRDLLLNTGDAPLAENSPRDFEWGCRDARGGYTGKNLLGRCLMRVRGELQAEQQRRGAALHGVQEALTGLASA